MQMFMDANLLPVPKEVKPIKKTAKADSLKADSLKKKLPVQPKKVQDQFNKVAVKPKNNAAAKQ